MILKVQIILFLIVIFTISEVRTAFCTKHDRDGSIIRVCCPGYTGDGYNCTSACPSGCPNGRCVAPNLCKCAKGFTKYSGPYSACEPIPTTSQTTIQMTTSSSSCFDFCHNGTCVNDLCTCAEGWLLQQHGEIGDICVPQCINISGNTRNNNSSCVNGYCSTTSKCVCFEGFELQDDNHFVCVSKSPISGSGRTWMHLSIINVIMYFVALISCYIFTLEVFIFM